MVASKTGIPQHFMDLFAKFEKEFQKIFHMYIIIDHK